MFCSDNTDGFLTKSLRRTKFFRKRGRRITSDKEKWHAQALFMKDPKSKYSMTFMPSMRFRD